MLGRVKKTLRDSLVITAMLEHCRQSVPLIGCHAGIDVALLFVVITRVGGLSSVTSCPHASASADDRKAWHPITHRTRHFALSVLCFSVINEKDVKTNSNDSIRAQ